MTSLEFSDLICIDISRVDLYTNLIWSDLNLSVDSGQMHFFLTWLNFTLSLMKKNKEWKMTFWMRYKHYEYTVMSFKLKNVLIIFQRLINDILREYLDDFVITYLNDILIYSDNLEMHCKHMCKILTKLNE